MQCPHIKFFKVRDSIHFQKGEPVPLEEQMMSEPLAVQNVYHMYSNYFSNCFFDPSSGIELDNGANFFEHVTHIVHTSLLLSSLQQFECMTTHSFDWWCTKIKAETHEEREQFAQSLAIYHTGGTQRYLQLKKTMEQLVQYNKLVYIITGNPAVKHTRPQRIPSNFKKLGARECKSHLCHR